MPTDYICCTFTWWPGRKVDLLASNGFVAEICFDRQALINAVHEKRYEEIRKATFGLVFFGTPHQGGNGATHADRIASVLSVITGQTKNTLLKALSKGSFLNEATTDQFRPQLNDYKVLTFYESKKTPLKKSWGWARSLTSAFVSIRSSLGQYFLLS